MKLFLGTAGWTVPKQHLALFPTTPEDEKLSHLQRYATAFHAVEINSSFHRPHRRSTWERWAASTPANFRFSVKAPKAITHTAKLVKTGAALLEFFQAIAGLGHKLGPILIQLPPKLAFDEAIAHEFFTTLREIHPRPAVLEPRHPTWFTAPVDRLLRSFEIARAAADPPKGAAQAATPGGWPGLQYWRLHGSPRTYYSDYDQPWLASFAAKLPSPKSHAAPSETWIIFDNTALGHATANALHLNNLLNPKS